MPFVIPGSQQCVKQVALTGLEVNLGAVFRDKLVHQREHMSFGTLIGRQVKQESGTNHRANLHDGIGVDEGIAEVFTE